MPLAATDITLDGYPAELDRLFDEVTRFCRENGLAADVEFDLKLALDELFANAVKHGGCAEMKRAVCVRLEKREDGIRAGFSDRGREFDPSTVPEPDLAATLAGRRVGGLGLHLVRQTMADFRYLRADGWNHLTMRRPI